MTSRRGYIAILALGLLVSGIFAMISAPISSPDAIQYDKLGYNLASGRGFSLSENAPYKPTMFREPTYSFFIAFMYGLFGHRPEAVVCAQIVMHAITGLLAYLIAGDIFSENAAVFSGIATAVFPTLANASSYILSETIFTFLLCLGVYVFLGALKSKKVFLFLVSGILFGFLALTRIVAIFLPLLLAVTAFIIETIKRRAARRLAAGLALMLAVFMLTISMWSVRNKAVFGTYSLTVRSGWALWSRAEKIDDSPGEMLTTACYSVSEYLGNKVFPDKAGSPERFLYRDLDKAAVLLAGYRKEGFTELEADAILKREAAAKILKHPVKYLAYTFVEAIKMTAFTYLPLLNEPRTVDYFGSIKAGHVLLTALKALMRILALPLLFLFLLGAVKNFRIWDKWILIFMVPAYFNVICSLIDATARYGVPLIPFYCIMASCAIFRPVVMREA